MAKKVNHKPKTNTNELLEILEFVQDASGLYNGEQRVQRRALGQRAESAWENVTDQVWDTSSYEYRLDEMPRLWLENGEVCSSEGQITVTEAKLVHALVKKHHKSGQMLEEQTGVIKTGGFVVGVYPGEERVKVGCEDFTFDDVYDFAKTQGWK